LRKSCLGCYYENEKVCYWFKLKGNSTPKKIPNDVVDKGCGKYENDSGGEDVLTPVILAIINKFDAEIIGSKYEPPVKKRNQYKKKYVKSAHNYSYRRDAQ